MGVVLAIDPGRRQGPALDRLTRELEQHEVVIATSGDEALAVLDGFIPDLIVFPVFLAPADASKLQARLEGLENPQDRRALTIPLGVFIGGEAEATRPTAVPPRWFYWFKPQVLEPEMADPQVFADAVRADVNRPRSTRTPAPGRVDQTVAPTPAFEPAAAVEGHLVRPSPGPPPAMPEREVAHPASHTAVEAPAVPQAAAAMWSRPSASPTEHEPLVESAHAIDGVVEPFGTASESTPRAATGIPIARLGAAFRKGLPALGRAMAGVGGSLGTAWQMFRRLPGAVKVSLPVVGILLTLGVSGQIGTVIESPARWAAAARERWFPATPPTGTAEIQTVPDGAEVWYQGRQLGVTPLRTELAVGSHEVELRYRNTTRTVTLDVTPGNTIVQRVEWAAPRTTGKLRVESDPSGAAVMVDGRPRGVTPLHVDDLTVGRHEVDVTMNGNTVRDTVEVKSGKTATLRTSIYQGWLALFSPIDLKLAVDGKPVALDDQQRVMLPSGSHQLTLQNRALGYEHTQTIEITPGGTTPVSVELPRTTLSITTSSPAEVWVDGERIGESPITDHPVDIGTRSVLARSTEHGERHVTVTATVGPARVSIDFTSAAP